MDRYSAKSWAYTRNQRRGLLSLLLLIGGVYLATHYVAGNRSATVYGDERLLALATSFEEGKAKRSPSTETDGAGFAFDPNSVSQEGLVRLGLSKKQAASFIKYRTARPMDRAADIDRLYVLGGEQKTKLKKWARFPVAEKVRATSTEAIDEVPQAQTFTFDPNTVTADSFQLLGFSAREATTLLKYRSFRERTFREPVDLQRIESLDSQRVQELLPFVNIAPAPPPNPRDTFASVPKPSSVDINRATVEEWTTLPGIGNYRAERIVAFRDQLGGFVSVEQVATVSGLPDSTYRAVAARLTPSPLLRQLRINRASVAKLAGHPYLSRTDAAVIVRYRDNHGPFADIEDLSRVRALDRETLERLTPYLNFAL